MDLKDLAKLSEQLKITQPDNVLTTAINAQAMRISATDRALATASKLKTCLPDNLAIIAEQHNRISGIADSITRERSQFVSIADSIAQERTTFGSIAVSLARERNWLDRITEATAFSSASAWLKNESFNRARIDSIVSAQAMARSETAMWIAEEAKRRKELFDGSFQPIRDLSISLESATIGVPSNVVHYPVNEVNRHIALVDVFTSEKDPIEEDSPDSGNEDLLKSFPELIKMLDGAKQAITTTNPDKQRHVIVSIRELLTHLLHRLAPDEKVIPWIPYGTEEQFLHRERPTRICRLSYICRDINSKPLNRFIDTDIDSMVKFIDLLQGGTHSARDSFSAQQLKCLVTRAEGIAYFLISVNVSGLD